MRKNNNSARPNTFAAVKARLAVEAALIDQDISVEVNGLSLTLRAERTRSILHFRELQDDQLELTLGLIVEGTSLTDMEKALTASNRPAATELQILYATGNDVPVALAKRIWNTSLDPLDAIRWCAACETLLLGHSSSDGFSKVPLEEDETGCTPALNAVRKTQEAFLNHLLEHFGDTVRVTASRGLRNGISSYGVPFGGAYFQFALLAASEDSCYLSANVFVGRLFNHRAYAIEWLLRNCTGKMLTWRLPKENSDDEDLQIGFCGLLPAGLSQTLMDTVDQILEEGETIAGVLGMWFPNLIPGDLVGSLMVRAHEPKARIALIAVSSPATFVEQFKEIIREHPVSDLEIQLPFKAALWAGAFDTAIEWAEKSEAVLRNMSPENQDEEKDCNETLSLCRQVRIRALKALGKFEEALAAFEEWASSQPPAAEATIQLSRASLYVRLRRLQEAGCILKKLPGHHGLIGLLNYALISAGLGQEQDAETALELYEQEAGEDIAARALLNEFQTQGPRNKRGLAQAFQFRA